MIVTVEPLAEPGVFRVRGRGFLPRTQAHVGGVFCTTRYRGPGEIDVVVPACLDGSPALQLANVAPATLRTAAVCTRGTAVRIADVRVVDGTPIGTGRTFALVVELTHAAEILLLDVTFPDGEQCSLTFRLDEDDARRGHRVIDGFQCWRGGELSVRVQAIDAAGLKDVVERIFDVVPSNPLQLYISPESSSSTGHAAAEWLTNDDDIRCRSRWAFSNGHPFAVTIGPKVKCRTSDANGAELDTFTFDIGKRTIPACTTITLFVTTSYGANPTGDTLRDFAAIRGDFTVESSQGELRGTQTWILMARVDITAIFVGEFSVAEMLKVKDVCETGAAEIYRQVDCQFARVVDVFMLPREHPDWERFREISYEADKQGLCVSPDEFGDLVERWSTPPEWNQHIDVFFVEKLVGAPCAATIGGSSPEGGPTSKNGRQSGVVIHHDLHSPLNWLWGELMLGVSVAHECAHYLGVGHRNVTWNLMHEEGKIGNKKLDPDQWETMREHGFVEPVNP